MPHYGLTLMRGDDEERSELISDDHLGVGDTFERMGERWLVEDIEESELGRVDAWLVCSPARDELLH